MSGREIPLTPGENYETQLGFVANSAEFQNNTPYWWRLPDQNHFVPPFSVNHVVSLVGTEVARILWEAPVGLTQPALPNNAAERTQRATVNYSPEPQQSAAGFVGHSPAGQSRRTSNIALLQNTTVVFTLPSPAENGIQFYLQNLGFAGIFAIYFQAILNNLVAQGPWCFSQNGSLVTGLGCNWKVDTYFAAGTRFEFNLLGGPTALTLVAEY